MQGLSWNQLFEEDKIDDVVLKQKKKILSSPNPIDHLGE